MEKHDRRQSMGSGERQRQGERCSGRKKKKKGKNKQTKKQTPWKERKEEKTELERRERNVMTPLEMMLSNQM